MKSPEYAAWMKFLPELAHLERELGMTWPFSWDLKKDCSDQQGEVGIKEKKTCW